MQWYGELQMYLINEVPDYEEILSDPSRVWNCDESGFPLSKADVGEKNHRP